MNTIQIIHVLEKHRKLLRENALFNSNEGNMITEVLKEVIVILSRIRQE